MDLEAELLEILEVADTKELVAALLSQFSEVAQPNQEGYQRIGKTLQHIEELISQGKENTSTTLWMAFWLGAAWQKMCHDAKED